MYQGIYKCRLCGETFSCGKKHAEKRVINKIAKMSVILPFALNDLGYTPHGCKDGSLGIADLQGFKKVEE